MAFRFEVCRCEPIPWLPVLDLCLAWLQQWYLWPCGRISLELPGDLPPEESSPEDRRCSSLCGGYVDAYSVPTPFFRYEAQLSQALLNPI